MFSIEESDRIRSFDSAYVALARTVAAGDSDSIRSSFEVWENAREALKQDVTQLASDGRLAELDRLDRLVQLSFKSLSARDKFLVGFSSYQEHIKSMESLLKKDALSTLIDSLTLNKIPFGPVSMDLSVLLKSHK